MEKDGIHSNRVLVGRNALAAEGAVRVVLLVARVLGQAVGRARRHGVVVVGVGQAEPRQPHGHFQPWHVQQTAVVVLGRRAHVHVQVALKHTARRRKGNFGVALPPSQNIGPRTLKRKSALVQSMTRSVQVSSISSVVLYGSSEVCSNRVSCCVASVKRPCRISRSLSHQGSAGLGSLDGAETKSHAKLHCAITGSQHGPLTKNEPTINSQFAYLFSLS